MAHENLKTVVVSLAACVATAYGISVLLRSYYGQKLKRLRQELEHQKPKSHLDVYPTFDENLIREQLTRNYSFLGEDRMKKLRKSFVVVVGLGGVGSHAAQMLVRSGVEKIRLVDFDQVTLSTLNRHAVAVHGDVGSPKVDAMKKHLSHVAPWAQIEAVNRMFCMEDAGELLEGNPDFVLDCIDNIDTKVDLILYCHRNNINVVSSMGAGAKIDPSRIQISDISDTFEDPLSRVVRKRLRKLGIERGVPVVYSTEKPGDVKLLPLPEEMVSEAKEYAILPDFRSRILPVIGTLPAMFGCALATFTLCKLVDWPIAPLSVKNRRSTYLRIYQELLARESVPSVKIDARDVGYVYEELWRGKSCISEAKENLVICKWDSSRDLTIENAVVMTKEEMQSHSLNKYDKVLRNRIEKILQNDKRVRDFWDIDQF